MSETSTKATYYFQSYQDYFWQWEIDYMFSVDVVESAEIHQGGINCISIPDGMTIAYKEQLEEVLKAISNNDLPPFGALILAFLATNSGEVGFTIDEIFTKIKKTFDDELTFKHVYFEDAQRFLKNLISLPLAYKKGKNRIDLFTFLFQDANHGLSSKYAAEVLACIKNDEFELNASSIKVEITMSALSKDFNSLALLHERYPTVDALINAWGKIVEVAIDPEDSERESFSNNPDLIQELIEEPKTFFMGSLIKRLWSGINLPMHYVHPGEMPLGGISDVTNKGNFDNLLISEFANDDLIFLHRIANKEALFIRRETTPEEDLRTRIFLIDTTIKNWGTPKILSFATAFSLIHHPKNEMNFQAYALLGSLYGSLDFDSKVSIIEGLQTTSPALDASKAITQFIEDCEKENVEITLFTSPKTLEHQSMSKVFNKYHDKFGGVITADINGNIDVYKMKSGAKRLVKHIQLPLDELWANPPSRRRKKNHQPRKKTQGKEVVNYPVLYGFPARNVVNFSDENYAYTLQKNGDLFRTNDRSRGFEMIERGMSFVTGIKLPMRAILFEDELMVLYWNALNYMIFKTQTVTYIFKEDLSQYEKVALKQLIVFEEEIYLVTKKHYNAEAVYTRFDVYDKTYEELTEPSALLKIQYENYLTQRIGYFEGSIFSKINHIIITQDLKIIFNSKHLLSFDDDWINFELIRVKELDLKDELTIYFHNRNLVADFENGCKIKIDKNGVIIFESTIPSIPTFYLSSYIGIGLAMATEDEFTGYGYFMPENSDAIEITVPEFKKKYVEPFLINILNS
ncbi:hypothetical protein H2O64_19660 [Kordia sp. YSTF-M3]|uniref:Uncharacterized protein n=1 Tax=Kordia aestuariivivens TaxID=2759037 RepID=A0ABR7QEA4_9FLAO|nr:hypothetical protein [Kordia aestuariivivens]MBC8756900.1 hypothetical protein [Kordia aestuariivivens]